jgi:regulator of protease activity HflC (stomatin/prohibitin superfamily)
MNKNELTGLPVGKIVKILVAVVVLLCIAGGSWYQVDQGDRAVVLRNGKIVDVADPGLHLKLPIIENTVEISTRQVTFTPAAQSHFEAYSYDQQPATLQLSVTYHVPDAKVADLYSRYGSIDNLQVSTVERKTFDVVKTVFGQYTAISAIQDRAKLSVDINNAVRKSMDGVPVTIDGVQIEDIAFSKAYEASIERRMTAEVEIQTKHQNLETEKINAEIAVTQANAEADSKRAAYKADADGILLRGDAEAKAIRARAEALAANTNLVNLNAIDKWDGKLPVSMVPGSSVPFLNIK